MELYLLTDGFHEQSKYCQKIYRGLVRLDYEGNIRSFGAIEIPGLTRGSTIGFFRHRGTKLKCRSRR